ncbi:MAG TPA: hypothetical protein VGM92_03225 [Candidatus Kapabacteria bacterium]|jgi:ferritin
MRLSVQYVNDAMGNIQAVQVPFAEWKKLLRQLQTFKEEKKIKSDITEALREIETMRSSKKNAQTLEEFLREL